MWLEMKKIAYLGPEKTFTEAAAKEIFPSEELVPIKPIRRVIRTVECGDVDFGVVPLENFYNGEVRETLDSLTECETTKIIMEKTSKIVHCLGALPKHGGIERVLSKDQALEQCSRYLCENYPDAETVNTTSTAEATRLVSGLDTAAIASDKALIDSGLEVLARDICPNNRTRFVVLGRNSTKSTGDDKTFIVIHPLTRDEPGVLYTTIGFFYGLSINLEYIQSRPDGKKGYFFYVEVDGHKEDESVKTVIDEVRSYLDPNAEHPSTVQILGSYPNTHWKE